MQYCEFSDTVKIVKFNKPEDFFDWHEQAKAYATANGYEKYLKHNLSATISTNVTDPVVFEEHEEDYDIEEVQGGELSSVPTANAQGQHFDSDGLCWDDNEIHKALTKYRNRVRKEEAELKAFVVILKVSIGPDYKNQFKEVIDPNIVIAHVLRIAQGGDVASAITRYTRNLQALMKLGHNISPSLSQNWLHFELLEHHHQMLTSFLNFVSPLLRLQPLHLLNGTTMQIW